MSDEGDEFRRQMSEMLGPSGTVKSFKQGAADNPMIREVVDKMIDEAMKAGNEELFECLRQKGILPDAKQ